MSDDSNYFELDELQCVQGMLEDMQMREHNPVCFDITITDANGDPLGRIAQTSSAKYVLYLPESQ